MKIILKNTGIVLGIVLLTLLTSLLSIGLERWFGLTGLLVFLFIVVVGGVVAFTLLDLNYAKNVKRINDKYK